MDLRWVTGNIGEFILSTRLWNYPTATETRLDLLPRCRRVQERVSWLWSVDKERR